MSGIFPPDIIAAAKASDAKWKVPASVALAQWALESDWGTRNMGAANNCFGIKPWKAGQPTTLQWTHEEVDGKLVRVQQKFCVFPSIAACFDAHGEFLTRNKRYAPAFLTADGIGFAKAIAKAGYATDSDYATKLTSLITRYGLMQFDGPRIAIQREPAPQAVKTPIAKAGAAGAGAAVLGTAAAATAIPGHDTAFIVVLALLMLAFIVFLVLHFRKKA